MQEYTAVSAVPGNALRNQGKGLAPEIQKLLAALDLRSIPANCQRSYDDWLDRTTTEILSRLKAEGRSWGAVRKALNLFIRACICDHYLRREYHLERIEPFAEIPLDSKVSKALGRLAGRGQLPLWQGLKRLTPEENRRFQAFAGQYAKQSGLPDRVYVDNLLWLKNR
jgi:hypothetical protein